jgi:hypothetical protein
VEIAMSKITEALRFMAENRHVHLLSRTADGFPTGYPMTAFADPAAGVVEFSTYRASAKVVNLLREGVGSVLARSYPPGPLRWVVVRGPIDMRDDASFLNGTRNPEDAARLPAGYKDVARQAHASGKRCVLRLTVQDVEFDEA